MLRTFCIKIFENFIRSLIKKRLKIEFPKIHLFFAASPDRQQTIFKHKTAPKCCALVQAIFNGVMGKKFLFI
jgi:hypothetical protein